MPCVIDTPGHDGRMTYLACGEGTYEIIEGPCVYCCPQEAIEFIEKNREQLLAEARSWGAVVDLDWLEFTARANRTMANLSR